jgi:hypothetical protein
MRDDLTFDFVPTQAIKRVSAERTLGSTRVCNDARETLIYSHAAY